MNNKTNNPLDNYVKEIQENVLTLRTQALEPNEIQKQKISTYIHAINLINKYFETNYLDHGLMALKLTDSSKGVLEGLVKKLPLKK